ncbi:AAA family ATPase [Flavivirga aquimarina]|uniref:AAA family ATPase n=1 Tax=Flavivirga aquimarina TaxID=2027862 RepID=A0ABT8W861_9FLAO|nr:AAA family ATPase [Flavivirga aquimarina]MDO5969306.1 AAA family ATPase [Flavivirga aquimarina]
MTIYQEILQWSASKSDFTKDALRRIITSQNLTSVDIDELVQLLKKEEGDGSILINSVPLDSSHLPTSVSSGFNYPKLISIKNPENICALYNQANLEFSNTGLIVVYGNNGSGKSSYSRILKKMCWSRDKSIDLKKNVFSGSNTQQKVEFVIEENGVNHNFTWNENTPSHPTLNSIFVFDSNCGDIYVNNENPTEYKPTGIDVLEKLIGVLNQISLNLDNDVRAYNTQKPILNENLRTTISGVWYQSIETKTKEQVDTYIQFSDTNKQRKEELTALLKTQDPQEKIKNLTELKTRLINYVQQFKLIEGLYNEDNLKIIKDLKIKLDTINKAYITATSELGNINSLSGFGSDHWRVLWNAAKDFSIKEELTDENDVFPSNQSLETCVLCQQDLDETAKLRLQGFSEFVLNDVSIKLNAVKEGIRLKIESINNTVILPFENYSELVKHIPEFEKLYELFVEKFKEIKTNIVSHLQSDIEINVTENILSKNVEGLVINTDLQIKNNTELSKNRSKLVVELNELLTKEFLHTQKVNIAQYHNEHLYKKWINQCKAKLNTTQISKKIGDLMDNQAVNLQHQEFVNHLQNFNQDLASKVAIAKTRTTSGITFQRCGFSDIGEGMNSILSEGEQKIVALSNFLAECTIDNRKNSIVFDDPVNSLDMDYRDLIAEQIVSLSADRQIIVLTHDLSFLRLLIDTHKSIINSDCQVIGIDKYNGISGIVTDEIPYLAKNVDERIDSIRRILRDHDSLPITDAHGREIKLDSARKRFRMLVERTVEEILSNKTYQRFSKNINLKKRNLSGYIVTEQSDVDILLDLFGKYSVTEHDGGTSTIPQLPNKQIIQQDITNYLTWKADFKSRLNTFVQSY